jgi:hypothetical protein
MTGGDADLKTVQTWIAGWLCGLAATGQVNVTADLPSVPRVTAGPEGTLDIIFDARPGSRRWKDWMVLLTPELRLRGPVRIMFHDSPRYEAAPGIRARERHRGI